MASEVENEGTRTNQGDNMSGVVSQARRQWAAVGNRIRAVTPSELGHLLMVAGLLGLLIWLVVASWPALVPFIIGVVVAYIMLPIVNWFDRLMPRWLAIILSLGGALSLLIFTVGATVPIVGNELVNLVDTIPPVEELRDGADDVNAWIATLPEPSQNIINDILLQIESRVQSNYDSLLSGLIDASIQGVATLVNTISFILGFIVVPSWVFSVLNDKERGFETFDQLLPDPLRKDVWALISILDRTFRAFVQSQLVQAILAGGGIYLGLVALEQFTGLEYRYKILFAFIIGFFQLLPEVGPILGGALAFLAALLNAPAAAVGVLLAHVIVQLLLRQFVTPRLERRFVNLHPALLVMAIVALSEFGPLWIVLAAPVIVVIRDLFTYFYGRISNPPLPAGVLPGVIGEDMARESLLTSPDTRSAKSPAPLVYRRGRSARSVQVARNSAETSEPTTL